MTHKMIGLKNRETGALGEFGRRRRSDSPPPPPRFGDPVSLNQPETLARISGFLRVAVKKTIY